MEIVFHIIFFPSQLFSSLSRSHSLCSSLRADVTVVTNLLLPPLFFAVAVCVVCCVAFQIHSLQLECPWEENGYLRVSECMLVAIVGKRDDEHFWGFIFCEFASALCRHGRRRNKT
jgi:hypothetical protein